MTKTPFSLSLMHTCVCDYLTYLSFQISQAMLTNFCVHFIYYVLKGSVNVVFKLTSTFPFFFFFFCNTKLFLSTAEFPKL